jgi:hypothetical protein
MNFVFKLNPGTFESWDLVLWYFHLNPRPLFFGFLHWNPRILELYNSIAEVGITWKAPPNL